MSDRSYLDLELIAATIVDITRAAHFGGHGNTWFKEVKPMLWVFDKPPLLLSSVGTVYSKHVSDMLNNGR